MKKIEGFFDKFKNKVASEVHNRVCIIEILKKNIGVELEMGDITISHGILRVKANPAVKNEMYIKKERILKEINSKIGTPKILSIQ